MTAFALQPIAVGEHGDFIGSDHILFLQIAEIVIADGITSVIIEQPRIGIEQFIHDFQCFEPALLAENFFGTFHIGIQTFVICAGAIEILVIFHAFVLRPPNGKHGVAKIFDLPGESKRFAALGLNIHGQIV